MSGVAVKVEGLSKRYRINTLHSEHETLVAAMAGWLRSPLSSYRRLRSLTHFDGDEADDVLWAVRDVSFEIMQGEVVGLIGGNGAGKSTLLKLLARITEPTRGRAEFRGRVASLLEVGTGFHPELSGRENIYLNGSVLGMRRTEVAAKFDEIVAFSGVEKFIDTPVKRYSSGMGVRLAFAVAAHLDPEILLIDEVLAVGDAAFQKKCLGRMQAVADEGRTVLFVSHQMSAVRNLCSRCLLMDAGEIKFEGVTEDCVNRYLSPVNGERSGIAETTDTVRQRPVDGMRINRVEISSGSGADRISNGDRLVVNIDFECLKDMRRVIAGFYVETPDGVTVLNTWNSESCPVATLSTGNHSFRGILPRNYLAPGEYFLGVIVATDRKGSGDWLPRVLQFSVTEKLSASIDEYWLQQAPGLLRSVESTWELDQDAVS